MRIFLLFALFLAAYTVIQASENELEDIFLPIDTLGEVVVTGQYQPQSIRNSVYRVRTIGSDEIIQRAATSIQGVLNTELGIRFANDLTLGESDIELMGMSGRNVKVLLDGLPLVDRGDTKQSLSQIDINTIDRIEIVEGPMSVIYGTDALAGVINLITKTPGEGLSRTSIAARFQEETAGSEYAFLKGAGTHNANVSLDWGRKAWSIGGGLTRNNFGGFKGISTGRQWEWLPKAQWLARGRAAYRQGQLQAWYALDYLDEDLSAPGALNMNNFRATDQNFLSRRSNHQLQAVYSPSANTSFQLAVSHQDYSRNTSTIIHDFREGTSRPSADRGTQDTSRFRSSIIRATMQQRLGKSWFLLPGVEVNLNSGSGQRMLGQPSINDYAFFLSSEWTPVKGVQLRPGLRFTKNSVYDAPPVIPSLNTKFMLGKDIDLRLAYARGFRAPALRELYFDFFDASHSIRGNEDLKAEYSNSFNAYLSWYGKEKTAWKAVSTLGGFYNDFRDQITTGFLPGDASITTYINIDRFRTLGASFEQALSRGNFQARVGFLYIGRYNRLSAEEPDVPAMRWAPEINSNLSYALPKSGWQFNLFYKYTGIRQSYETIPDGSGGQRINRAEIAAYQMADFTISKRFMPHLNLTGGVRNLFDVTRLDNSSLNTGEAHSTGGAVPLSYGRSFFLGLSYQLSINKND